jgi:hypothetical protein
MKIIASWQTLMSLARELGDAKKTGNPELIAEAQKRHDAYKEVCLKADEIHTGYPFGSY